MFAQKRKDILNVVRMIRGGRQFSDTKLGRNSHVKPNLTLRIFPKISFGLFTLTNISVLLS